jgi:P27 family predicted phage terminase small subunit
MPRLRKPLALRVLEGNREHRPLPTGEPNPQPMLPPCPGWLTGEGKAFWERMAPRLYRLGLLTELDTESLAVCSQMYGRWRQAEQSVQRSLEATGRFNRLRVITATRYLDRFNQLAAAFGMTPAARAHITGVGDREEADDGFGILS